LPFKLASLFAAAGGALGPDPAPAPDPGELPHWPEQPAAGEDTRAQPDAKLAAKSNAKQTMSRTSNFRIFPPMGFAIEL
jgi:hypothetical protein